MGKWCRQYEDDYQAGLKRIRGPSGLPAQADGESVKLFEELQFARLAAFLRHRKPDDQVNASILIYRLTDRQTDEALRGASAELHVTNGVKR